VEGSTQDMAVVWTAAITLEQHYIVDSTITTFQLLTGVVMVMVMVITTMVAVGAVITMLGNPVGSWTLPTGSRGALHLNCTRNQALPCTTIWTTTSGQSTH